MRMWTFPKLAVVCGLLGAILAAAIAVRIPHQYVSEALLVVSGDVTGLQGFRDQVLERAFSEASIRELIRKNDLYAAERRRIPWRMRFSACGVIFHLPCAGSPCRRQQLPGQCPICLSRPV